MALTDPISIVRYYNPVDMSSNATDSERGYPVLISVLLFRTARSIVVQLPAHLLDSL